MTASGFTSSGVLWRTRNAATNEFIYRLRINGSYVEKSRVVEESELGVNGLLVLLEGG